MVIKKHIKKRKPKLGDTRWVKRFALFPKRINDDELIWMCWYEKQQKLEEDRVGYYEEINCFMNQWVDMKTKDGYIVVKFKR